jgi:hypothetical protein
MCSGQVEKKGSESGRDDHAPRPPGIALEAVCSPPGQEHQARLADALRLLASWAVRAARAQVAEEKPLDCSPPGSHECTPNRSTGEDLT